MLYTLGWPRTTCVSSFVRVVATISHKRSKSQVGDLRRDQHPAACSTHEQSGEWYPFPTINSERILDEYPPQQYILYVSTVCTGPSTNVPLQITYLWPWRQQWRILSFHEGIIPPPCVAMHGCMKPFSTEGSGIGQAGCGITAAWP